MEDKIEVLRDAVIAEMVRLGFADTTIAQFKRDCSKFVEFSAEKGTDCFREDIGAEYLLKHHGYPNGKTLKTAPVKMRLAVWCIRRLGDMKQFGALIALKKQIPNYEWAGDDIELIQQFMEHHYRNPERSQRTKDSQEGMLKVFYRFLGFHRISGVSKISAQTISDYVKSLQGYATISINSRLRSLKQYFAFLYKQGLCTTDWSTAVPRVKCIQNLRVPTLWDREKISAVLDAINREAPVGKRDYAILLLVAELGIRSSDIAAMKMANLNFLGREISFTQCKTQRQVTLHLTDRAGWALIDYIRYGRPQVENSHLFLTAVPPHIEFRDSRSVGSILDRGMKKAGIPKTPGFASGMHSLRHALARRLLEQGEDLSTVSAVMGHVKSTSATPYLKVDIEGLRGCTLTLPTGYTE